MTDRREVSHTARQRWGARSSRRLLGVSVACVTIGGSLFLLPRAALAGDTQIAVPSEVLADARDGSAEIIIQLRPEATNEGDELMSQIGETGADVLPTFGVVTADVNASQLKDLANSGLVARIEPDLLLSPQLDRSTTKVGATSCVGCGPDRPRPLDRDHRLRRGLQPSSPRRQDCPGGVLHPGQLPQRAAVDDG